MYIQSCQDEREQICCTLTLVHTCTHATEYISFWFIDMQPGD